VIHVPFGAHEALEVHEILNEKICTIDHFALYSQQASDPAMREMIDRHRAQAIRSYNELVSYTHDTRAVVPNEVQFSQVTSPNNIQYGLNNPPSTAPLQMGVGQFYDEQIARSVLLSHKNSAKNHMKASLECADPYVRQMLLNGSNTCNYAAYEVFDYMNARGLYQVPTMRDHTAKTFLHAYQAR
jgi:spore coat protein CotF